MSNFIYNKEYNIRFSGLERFHPFDTCKYEKIADYLTSIGVKYFYSASEVTDEQLLEIHTQEYLDKLNSSYNVASFCEMYFMSLFPISFIRNHILKPMRYQVNGTILAGEIAIEKGWSINLGGGFHHSSSHDAWGWCLYSDIPLSIKNLMDKGKIGTAMIIDLDVHQGNGIERDIKTGFFKKKSVYMIDAYNHDIGPDDKRVKRSINIDIKVDENTTDKSYLSSIKKALTKSLKEFKPDVVFYNAGTDILDGDTLNGGVSISESGVVKRDELVMKTFIDNNIPIVMLLSGGYSSNSVNAIQQSIKNMYDKFLK